MKLLAPLFSLLLLGAAGCATPKDEAIVPFTQEQLNALFTRARPPQVFGLTVYSSDGGPVFAGGNRVPGIEHKVQQRRFELRRVDTN